MNAAQGTTRLVRAIRSQPLSRHNAFLKRAGGVFCQLRRIETSSGPAQDGRIGDISRVPIIRPSIVRRALTASDNSKMVKSEKWRSFDPIFLRDSCICPRCVDPSTKQKNFQTTDIPEDIRVTRINIERNDTVTIHWQNDIPGFGKDHFTVLPRNFFDIHSSCRKILDDHFQSSIPQAWNKELITRKLQYVDYHDYMTTPEGLYRALQQLYYYGLLLIREVPDSEDSVANIANRIGTLRDTFYGRTWDVKSVPEAKNVAYTAQFLGLHMDLLYMANPPGFQFLHCLKNTCQGGTSLFSDTFEAVKKLSSLDESHLREFKIPYHYRNAGEHYWYTHPVITKTKDNLQHVNYSPPFQATLLNPMPNQTGSFFGGPDLRHALKSLRNFTKQIESEENLFEHRLQEGECVIFNNRRVLHGRRQFDAVHGERWLKGAYIDTDVFMSRWRVMREKWGNKEFRSDKGDARYVYFGTRKPNLEASHSIEEAPSGTAILNNA